MDNVSSDSSPISRLRSGRTYWVRSNLSPPAKDNERRSPKQTSNKRFVEPMRLSDTQRAEILVLLEKRGIGDADSRNLFVSAMEYDLAGCRDMQRPAIDGPAAESARKSTDLADKVLAELGAAAEALARRLVALDDAKRKHLLQRLTDADPFKRGYGNQYLTALQVELNQLGTVARLHEQATEVPTPPALSNAARRFIQRAADAFRDCFEQKPTVKRESPFLTALEAVVTTSGIAAPTDPATIREILG